MNWWTKPHAVAIWILMPLLLVCLLLPNAAYIDYNQAQKYIDSSNGLLTILALATFAIFSLIGTSGTSPQRSYRVDIETLDRTINSLLFIVLACYAYFFFPVAMNPTIAIDHFHGSAQSQFALRETLNSLPGVTSLMALQSLALVLILKRKAWSGKETPRAYRIAIAVLVTFCVLRAWLWSERLALLELALPYAILTFGRDNRRIIKLAPLFGIVLVSILFIVGEYFRSWQTAQANGTDSFIVYAVGRLAGYYATAVNNGASLYTYSPTLWAPTYTAHWFHKFPLFPMIGISTEGSAILGERQLAHLLSYTTPEFNNVSGLFVPFLDYGVILGLGCFACLGFLTGSLFKRYATDTSLFAAIFYPVWFLGITELIRVFYWGNSRFFPVIVAALVLSHTLKQRAALPRE